MTATSEKPNAFEKLSKPFLVEKDSGKKRELLTEKIKSLHEKQASVKKASVKKPSVKQATDNKQADDKPKKSKTTLQYVQPVLTFLTVHALEKFCSLNTALSHNLSPKPEPKEKSKSTSDTQPESPHIFVNGNTTMFNHSHSRPDSFIVLKSALDNTTDLSDILLIGEAKAGGPTTLLPLREVLSKGSFPSPKFGYMSIYIAIADDIEIGLYSPFYGGIAPGHDTKPDIKTDTKTDTRVPVIFSRTFTTDPKHVNDMLSHLDSLVTLMSALYNLISKDLVAEPCYRKIGKQLSTYLIWVDKFPRQGVQNLLTSFSEPAQATPEQSGVQNLLTSFSEPAQATPEQSLSASLKLYAQTLNAIPTDKPHIVKRACADKDSSRYANLKNYLDCCSIDMVEKLYLLGPIIEYEAAADGKPLDTTADSSLHQSQSRSTNQVSPQTTLSFQQQISSARVEQTTLSDVFLSIISAEAPHEFVFAQWTKHMQPTPFDDVEQFKSILIATNKLHKAGFAHCDIRRPNIVVSQSPTTTPSESQQAPPTRNLALVDMEYAHKLSEKEMEKKLINMYQSLKSLKSFEWFVHKSRSTQDQIGFDTWAAPGFILLDYYSLVRSFYLPYVEALDTDDGFILPHNHYPKGHTQLAPFSAAVATFLGQMFTGFPTINNKTVEEMEQCAQDLFDTLDQLFKKKVVGGGQIDPDELNNNHTTTIAPEETP